MKTLFKILVIGLPMLMIGCSKDNTDCDPTDEKSPCYAGAITGSELLLVEHKRNGKIETQFEYNDQNQATVQQIHGVDGSVHTYQFTRDALGRVVVVERSTGNKMYLREEYVYAAGDKPTSGVWTSQGSLVNIQYTYLQNIVTETSYNDQGEVIGTSSYTFDDNGNLVQTVIGEAITVSGDFDDKHYCFTNYPFAWKIRSVNNARSFKVTARVGSVDQRWEYTYNAAGYPTQAEVYDRQSKVLVETHTYAYVAAK